MQTTDTPSARPPANHLARIAPHPSRRPTRIISRLEPGVCAARVERSRVVHCGSWPSIGFEAILLAMSPSVILVAILGLSVLVIVHEAGHYFAARFFGMRVTRFSIGFGPALVTYRPRNSPTTFQICAIPFLGYVMIAGLNPVEEIDPDDPGSYSNKSVFARIVTSFAGPFANYLAASLL